MTPRACYVASLAFACAALGSGCHGRSAERAQAPSHPTSAQTARLVEEQLRMDPRLGIEPIHAQVEDGVAVLDGRVSSLVARDRALWIAKNTLGVRAVVDQIAVVPASVPDAALQRDVLAALQQNPATRGGNVSVAVQGGAVTLRGAADSWAQRGLFASSAGATRGVSSVDNLIVVHPRSHHSDAEISADVTQRIRFDVWLDGYPIEVAVRGGVVGLRGEVATIAQKERATADAWLEGVQDVDASAVSATGRLRGPDVGARSGRAPTDAESRAAIQAALREDPRVGVLVPRVSVRAGVARLEGTVGSIQASSAATEDARDTLGIADVRDDTQVAPQVGLGDKDIQRAVEKQLAEDVTTQRDRAESGIRVSVTNGRVLLEGHVQRSFEALAAVGDAKVIPGVVSVEDRLVVDQIGADLGREVEQQLARDPLVDAREIRVQVSGDQTVTLAGMVDSWTEVRAAAADAVGAGARRVVNLLQVKNQPGTIAP